MASRIIRIAINVATFHERATGNRGPDLGGEFWSSGELAGSVAVAVCGSVMMVLLTTGLNRFERIVSG
jgi:hypothetical protein